MKPIFIFIFTALLLRPITALAAPPEAGFETALAHKKQADALVRMDRAKEAIVEYQKALVLEPEWANAHFNLAIAYFQSGRLREAVECLERVLEIHPEDSEAMFNLGCLKLRQQRMDEAEACFRKCRDCKEAAFKTRSTQALEWMRELKAADPQDREAVLIFLQRLATLAPGF